MEKATAKDQAWVGDAVLSLFARRWLLKHAATLGGNRAQLFIDLTCNQFLSSFGEPTEVEARIGRLFEEQGLEPALAYLEKEFIPVFLKQQRNKRPARR